MASVTVLGAGAWGTALSLVAVRAGHTVTLWGRSPDKVEQLRRRGQNSLLLPGVKIPRAIRITASLTEALRRTEVVVVTVPSHGVRPILREAEPVCPASSLVISGTKGFELSTWRRMSQVIQDELKGRPGIVLSGPSHAEEVARGWPTAVTMAGEKRWTETGAHLLAGPMFRIYQSRDVVGVECGGAFKNVIAIAAGLAEGLKMGDNAKAALYTRGLAELARLGVAMGGEPLTFSGLAGLGDLLATCLSPHSRNRFVGIQLAQGRPLSKILAGMRKVAEGVNTTKAMMILAKKYRVRVPIAEQVARVLFHGKPPRRALEDLLARQSSNQEFDF